jgi:hypothetical protein
MTAIAARSLAKDGQSLGNRSLKNANRSAMTNDLLASRANARTARGRRIRDLFKGLLARVGAGPHDVVTEAHALRVAELVVACEDIRAGLAGKVLDVGQVNAITRLESTAARAERAFLKAAPVDTTATAELDAILADYRGAPDECTDQPG